MSHFSPRIIISTIDIVSFIYIQRSKMDDERHLMCGSSHKDSSSSAEIKFRDARPAIGSPLVDRSRAATQKSYEENKAKDDEEERCDSNV